MQVRRRQPLRPDHRAQPEPVSLPHRAAVQLDIPVGVTPPQIGKQGCVFFSTAEIPAYKFRFCGLNAPQLGNLRQGDPIGKGDTMQFAALRKQPDGKWAIVEPAKNILERTLKAS